MVIYQINFTLMVYIVLVQKMHRQFIGKMSRKTNKKQKKTDKQKTYSAAKNKRFILQGARSWAVFQSGWKCTLLWKPPHCFFFFSICLHVIIVHPGLQASKSHTEVLGTSDAALNSCMFLGEWHTGHEWVKMGAWRIFRVSLKLSPI